MRAVQENGPADSWDIGEPVTMEGAEKLYDIFAPYIMQENLAEEKTAALSMTIKP